MRKIFVTLFIFWLLQLCSTAFFYVEANQSSLETEKGSTSKPSKMLTVEEPPKRLSLETLNVLHSISALIGKSTEIVARVVKQIEKLIKELSDENFQAIIEMLDKQFSTPEEHAFIELAKRLSLEVPLTELYINAAVSPLEKGETKRNYIMRLSEEDRQILLNNLLSSSPLEYGPFLNASKRMSPEGKRLAQFEAIYAGLENKKMAIDVIPKLNAGDRQILMEATVALKQTQEEEQLFEKPSTISSSSDTPTAQNELNTGSMESRNGTTVKVDKNNNKNNDKMSTLSVI